VPGTRTIRTGTFIKGAILALFTGWGPRAIGNCSGGAVSDKGPSRNDIYKEWVESHRADGRRASPLAPRNHPFGGAVNISRKRIEINAKLLFLLVTGRGIQLEK
jgi:hypothetical protein